MSPRKSVIPINERYPPIDHDMRKVEARRSHLPWNGWSVYFLPTAYKCGIIVTIKSLTKVPLKVSPGQVRQVLVAACLSYTWRGTRCKR